MHTIKAVISSIYVILVLYDFLPFHLFLYASYSCISFFHKYLLFHGCHQLFYVPECQFYALNNSISVILNNVNGRVETKRNSRSSKVAIIIHTAFNFAVAAAIVHLHSITGWTIFVLLKSHVIMKSQEVASYLFPLFISSSSSEEYCKVEEKNFLACD